MSEVISSKTVEKLKAEDEEERKDLNIEDFWVEG